PFWTYFISTGSLTVVIISRGILTGGRSNGVGGEFPIVPHEHPNEVALWSIGPAPNSSCASTRVHQGGSTRRRSIGRSVATFRVARPRASRTHLTPPSASDSAHDSAAASDTTGNSPARR